MDYLNFLESKLKPDLPTGFNPVELSPFLFDFQRAIVEWAIKRGRAAVFADCGLGKTPMQLEWAHRVSLHTGGNVLVLTPLAVADQTVNEADKFGIVAQLSESQADIIDGDECQIFVTNYEKLHHYDASKFSGIVLDESSILKNFDGATRKQLQEFAASIPFRLCCSATPAPNDLIELTNHSEFLGVMSGKEIIALFFTQDGNTTHHWRLKGHAKRDFWRWLATWSVAIRKPSDLGFDDRDFVLPPLQIIEHIVPADHADAHKEGLLLAFEASTMDERRKARRGTLAKRVAMAAEIANSVDGQCLVWCGLNSESEQLTKAITSAVEVKGSDSTDHKRTALRDFTDGAVTRLVSKPSIAGWGLNWQKCRHMVFVGLSDSYEELYQAIRRCYRFGQTQTVNVHIVTADIEGKVVENIKRKERQATQMFDELVKETSIFSEVTGSKKDEAPYIEDDATGNNWRLMLGDSCKRIKELPDNSMGLCLFSPPFPGMYAYSNSARDIGNSTQIDEMIEHFGYMVPDLLRITMPGRLCCVHLMQLTAMQGRDGYIGLKDYRGKTIDLFSNHGWRYAGEVCVDKNPQIQATRNKERGLMFKTLANDSSKMRMALADYLIYFRKDGDNPVPIKAGISEKYNNPQGWITETEWIEWAAPVWYRHINKGGDSIDEFGRETFAKQQPHYPGLQMETRHIRQKMDGSNSELCGIQETDCLNVKQARETDDERHLCPLQLSVIERAIKLWSAPGETVFSPFAGVGSEGYMALKLNRKFVGIELKPSYWASAQRNLNSAKIEVNNNQTALFADAV